MKFLTAIFLLLITNFAVAQSSFLKEAVTKLEKALIAKDTVVLKQLLHKDVTYGHSNGWVQTKPEIVGDFASGKMTYTKMESKDLKWTATNDIATVRSTTDVGYTLNGNSGEMKLHVLQVWLKTNKGWQLLSRQAVKL